MKLIIGLGNPDKKYQKNYHNAGFLAADFLKEYFQFNDFKLNQKFLAQISDGKIDKENILIVKPQTYMNNSGESVKKILDFYKLSPSDILLIYDDFEIPFGTIRIREQGSDGGHLGVRSVIERIGSQNFKRIRIGISNGIIKEPLEKYVLKNFKPNQLAFLNNHILPKIPELILKFVKNEFKNETLVLRE